MKISKSIKNFILPIFIISGFFMGYFGVPAIPFIVVMAIMIIATYLINKY